MMRWAWRSARSGWCSTASTARPSLSARSREQLEHLLGGARVERRDGLVGEDHRRLLAVGARDRDALRLPARERARLLPGVIEHPDALERDRGALADLAREARAGQRAPERQLRRARRQQTLSSARALLDERDLLEDDRRLAAREAQRLAR